MLFLLVENIPAVTVLRIIVDLFLPYGGRVEKLEKSDVEKQFFYFLEIIYSVE
jgi:hypothetical protein